MVLVGQTENNYWSEFVTVRDVVLDMLEKRGIPSNQLNRNVDMDFLRRQFKLFVESVNSKELEGAYSCDIVAIQPSESGKERKTYVHFTMNPSETPQTLEKKLAQITRIYDLLPEHDDIDVVVFRENMDADSILYDVEKSDKYNVRVFYYKRLMFDITKHTLVPTHQLVPKSECPKLKKELMLNHFNQLPTLLVSDAVSRFYHFRKGSVVRIERPSIGNMKHIAYRYVQ
jgi:DNA-directed RNA polymerase subunit H (RpoH/RPB5)